MSYTLSDFQAVSPDGTPRVGWVQYLVTLGDGRTAQVGVWVNGDYSCAPDINADLSARSLSGGTYAGWNAVSTAPYDLADWGDYDPTIPGDSAAMAEIASTAADPAVAAAVSALLSGLPGAAFAVSGTLLFDGGFVGNFTTIGQVVTGSIALADYSGSPTTQVDAPPAWSTTDPTVVAVTPATDGLTFSATCTGHGSADIAVSASSRAAPSIAASSSVTG